MVILFCVMSVFVAPLLLVMASSVLYPVASVLFMLMLLFCIMFLSPPSSSIACVSATALVVKSMLPGNAVTVSVLFAINVLLAPLYMAVALELGLLSVMVLFVMMLLSL